jgi:predicted peptidase
MKIILTLLAFVFAASSSMAQDTSAYEKKLYISGTDTLRYRILYPENYSQKKRYPVIVVLHGSGERGRDNAIQLVHGAKLFVADSNRTKYPAIVIFPQCPSDSGWARTVSRTDSVTKIRTFTFPSNTVATTPMRLVKEMLDQLQKEKHADPKRMYVGGLSMGGFGTFDMLARYPGYFVASFPICGGGDTTNAAKITGKTSLWVFHGGADPVVNPQNSRDYVAALKEHGADVQYTEYPGVGHNSWDNAFAEPQLLPWLFSHKK